MRLRLTVYFQPWSAERTKTISRCVKTSSGALNIIGRSPSTDHVRDVVGIIKLLNIDFPVAIGTITRRYRPPNVPLITHRSDLPVFPEATGMLFATYIILCCFSPFSQTWQPSFQE